MCSFRSSSPLETGEETGSWSTGRVNASIIIIRFLLLGLHILLKTNNIRNVPLGWAANFRGNVVQMFTSSSSSSSSSAARFVPPSTSSSSSSSSSSPANKCVCYMLDLKCQMYSNDLSLSYHPHRLHHHLLPLHQPLPLLHHQFLVHHSRHYPATTSDEFGSI